MKGGNENKNGTFRSLNPLPNNKILDYFNLKAFADDKFNHTRNMKYAFHKGKKNGKRRKCWLPTFFHFPTLFSKGLFLLEVCYYLGLCDKGL